MSLILYSLLSALVAPLLLIPVETLIPVPFVVEEVVKLFIVLLLVKQERKTHTSHLYWVILAGILFTFSESMLYLINIFMVGDLTLFGTRLLLTGALHVGTMLILYWSSKKQFGWMLGGFIIAATIHYWYNATIVSLLTK